jgi:Txe/YoeB family toxin of toxin-antitoxin system
MNIKKVAFELEAFADFGEWGIEDKKVFKKKFSLIKDIQRDPFSGIGKPEPLKYELQGYWSIQKYLLIFLPLAYFISHIPHPQLSQIKKAIKVVHNN